MGDNKARLKNDRRDVAGMGLMQAERASITKLSGMDHTGRTEKWNEIKGSLKTESGSDNYSFLHTNAAIRC